MTKTYECGICGVISKEKSHVCNPRTLESRHDYCGQSGEKAEQMCEPMSSRLEYECTSCGRPAETPEMVCSPGKIR